MVIEEKKRLRREIRERKKAYSTQQKLEKSVLIFSLLEQLPQFEHAQTIMLYWAMDDEVQTQDFIKRWFGKKRIILPVVNGDELLLKEFTGLANMQEGASFAILEPSCSAAEVSADQPDLIVVPGVAFDLQNNRMGRGKGYYDKLLHNAKAYKVGVCFDFQLVERIPTESFDVKMDKVIYG